MFGNDDINIKYRIKYNEDICPSCGSSNTMVTSRDNNNNIYYYCNSCGSENDYSI